MGYLCSLIDVTCKTLWWYIIRHNFWIVYHLLICWHWKKETHNLCSDLFLHVFLWFYWLDNINLFDHFWIQICSYVDITFAVLVSYFQSFLMAFCQENIHYIYNTEMISKQQYALTVLVSYTRRRRDRQQAKWRHRQNRINGSMLHINHRMICLNS